MSPTTRPWSTVTLTEFTVAFVSFALLLGLALLAPEYGNRAVFDRTIYTVWVTTALLTVALCAFALPGRTPAQRAYWILFWTSSFVVYGVHLYYAIAGFYHGNAREALRGQGLFSVVNCTVVTLWWAFDLALAWRGVQKRWIDLQRIGIHVYAGTVFFTTAFWIKRGFVNVIGIVMALAIGACLLLRYNARKAAALRVASP